MIAVLQFVLLVAFECDASLPRAACNAAFENDVGAVHADPASWVPAVQESFHVLAERLHAEGKATFPVDVQSFEEDFVESE